MALGFIRYQKEYQHLGQGAINNNSRVSFSLEKIYHDLWVNILEFYRPFCDGLLNQQDAQLTSQEWVGLYRNLLDALQGCVVRATYLKESNPSQVQFNVEFMSTFSKYNVGSQYFTMTHVKPNTKNATPPTTF